MNKKSLLKIFFISFVILLVIFLMTSYFFYQTQKKSKAGGEAVTVLLSPSFFSFTANQDLITALKIQPSVEMTIKEYYLIINFDKTKLQVKNIEYKLGTPSQDLGDDNSKLSTINQTGTIKIVGEIQTTTGYILSSAQQTDVAGLTFNSVSEGNTSITIDTANSKIVKINADSSLSEVPVVMAGITSSPTSITPTSEAAKCNEICAQAITPPISESCQGDLICWSDPTIILQTAESASYCRNPNCPTDEDCDCVPPSPTPLVSSVIVTVTPSYPTDQPVPTPITLSLKLRFQGIQKRPADQFNNMLAKISVVGDLQVNPVSQTVNFISDDEGIWSGTVTFNDLPSGSNYKLLVKAGKHIQKKICDQTSTETYPGSYHCGQGKITLISGINNLDFSGIYQLVGDLPDQDGIVNSYDVSLVRNSLNKGDSDSLRLADLNLDGVVNAQDYSLVIAALSIRSDEE